MDERKLLVLFVLSVFVVGMVMGAASATHTFKIGKYKAKVSDKKYKKMKNAAKKVRELMYFLKLGNIKHTKYLNIKLKK